MAADVDVCNLALQKLGATRIASITENSRNGRSCNTCYANVRDKELRKYRWKFAHKQVVLAPLTTAPPFDYLYGFQLPSDCLRVILRNDNDLDWKIMGQVIYTNSMHTTAVLPTGQTVASTPTLELTYIARITDPNAWDPCFLDAVAARMAYQMCEEITQSNTKKQDMLKMYDDAIADARLTDSFEVVPEEEPTDTWITAQL